MDGHHVHSSGKVFCFHCDSYVSRMTAYRHARANNLRHNEDNLDKCTLVDARRKRRCETSSDEEEIISTANTCCSEELDTITPSDTWSPGNIGDLVREEGMHDSESDQSDETSDLDQINSVVWDEATLEAMVQDVTEPDTLPLPPREQCVLPGVRRFVFWVLYALCILQCCHLLSNRCMEHLLLLLKQIFIFLGNYTPFCSTIASVFPSSLFLLRKYIGFERDDFTKYVVCPNCYTLYRYNQVVYTDVSGQAKARVCTNHVYSCKSLINPSSKRKGKLQCGSPLVKEVKDISGKTLFYPLKLYCYKGVINVLEQFLQRPGFDGLCQKWQKRTVTSEYLSDVYDGKIWEKFLKVNGQYFLCKPFHYGVMINVDWFQPYKRRRDISVGVIYMVIMNLPREMRFKPENVILVGIIPALRKEPETLNSFLRPMVEELKCLWRGVDLKPAECDNHVKVKAVLLCAAADIPAARKLCGFLGHSALQGCSHCSRKFVDITEKKCYGGFEVDNWPIRTRADHIKYSKKAETAKTFTDKTHIEKLSGYRYTALLDLEYFEPSSFLAIDPMHNLFLGTAKKMLNCWIENELLSKQDLVKLSERVTAFNVCSDVGRIPCNISTNYGQFTAQEWKNWVLIYSIFCLNNLLPLEHLRVWQTFVLACKHICKPCISQTDVNIAHRLFVKFCKEVEQLYGSSFITPNMHLHCHLKESITNYGSVYGFWLFSYERYNGLLGDFCTNNRSIEIQLMRKFQLVNFIGDVRHKNLEEFQENLNELVGTYDELSNKTLASVTLQTTPTCALDRVPKEVWSDLSLIQYKLSGFQLYLIPVELRPFLHQMYKTLYGNTLLPSKISDICKKIKCIYLGEYLYGGSGSRSASASIIYAKWANNYTQICPSADFRPAKVKYYLCHTVELNDGRILDHILAVVEWFKPCQADLGYLPPVYLWDTKCQNDGPATFLPVQRIHGRCAFSYESVGNRKYLIISHIPNHVFM